MRATTKNIERDAAIERLREWVKDGDTVYTILRHRAASGMSRTIQLIIIEGEQSARRISHIGYNVALAIGARYDRKKEGIVIRGCGFDAGDDLVRDLASALGYKLRQEWL